MDEELQKRNTDCVYFLASPLTCKKGIDCEYRHSEMARLNPRDCWYWLSGSCLNPTCAFRHPSIVAKSLFQCLGMANDACGAVGMDDSHCRRIMDKKPLDVHAGAVAESPHCSTPVNKTNVPCYFYFHGFCNKGDRCSFMHGPDGNAPAVKCTKSASTSSEPAVENKTSARSERGSAPVEIHLNPSESVSKYPCESVSKVPPSLHVPPREELQQPVPKNLFLQSASPPVTVCEYDDVVVRSESFIPAEGFLQGRSYDCTDQSSEEEVEDHIEHEERWDSSPGFDVLVDDKSENLGYEDDLEYLQDLDREHREPSSRLLVYDFEDSLEYDPACHKPELRCERDIYDGFDHLGDEHLFNNVKRVPGHSRRKMMDSILSSKRKLVPMGLPVGDCCGIDLRDHLRRRRVIDGRRINGLSRRHGSSYLIDCSQKRPRRHGMGQRLHRRLASEVGKNTIESLGEKGTFLNGANQYGLLKWSQQDRSKKHFRKRLPKGHFSSEISRKPIKRRSTQESTTFTGPKTLSQIKEEKQKAEENGGYNVKIGNSSRTTLADFRGPKPLSEILQDKRRLDSVREGDTSSL